MRSPWVVVLAFLLTGCPPTILRQRDSYVAEVAFTDRMLRESSSSVHHFIQRHCACENNVWRSADVDATEALCQSTVDWWLVYRARWDWHRRMMLFNARLLDVQPGAAPTIPPRTCNLPAANIE